MVFMWTYDRNTAVDIPEYWLYPPHLPAQLAQQQQGSHVLREEENENLTGLMGSQYTKEDLAAFILDISKSSEAAGSDSAVPAVGITERLDKIHKEIKDGFAEVDTLETSLKEFKIHSKKLTKENQGLKRAVNSLRYIVKSQQRYLEQVDAKHREKNIVLKGLSEGQWNSKTEDKDKVADILSSIGHASATAISMRRLGKPWR